LTFDRKNNRKNLDEQQTTPVSDPERFLKPKGYPKSTTATVVKKYQPKVAPVNTNFLVEELTPEENSKRTPFVEDSTCKPDVSYKNPVVIESEIKSEVDPSETPNSPNKRIASIPVVVNFFSTPSSPEEKVSDL